MYARPGRALRGRRGRPRLPHGRDGVAATRLSRRGRAFGAAERVSVAQALRAQTIDAAWQLGADGIAGSLAPGKYADLAVLSGDPLRTPPEEIEGLTVRGTYLAGEPVHAA
ncbi:amidohydrolase family protein [Actinomadura sp. WMMB 499]|uniref:amidohydrolase family protein n=1 Tax=Actinomadura sp. WMMB 499 TaxID=1219491 RepID=UPI00124694A2|nr:amidohydrolase family protein [Actinomadura sp. WMMB 499]QFG23124.1 amidohydrolase family protein [Actinomadura sp. WMMB 499]